MKFSKLLHFAEAWLTLAVVDIQVSFMPYRYWRNELTGGLKHEASQFDKTTTADSAEQANIEEKITRTKTSTIEGLLTHTVRPLIAVS